MVVETDVPCVLLSWVDLWVMGERLALRRGANGLPGNTCRFLPLAHRASSLPGVELSGQGSSLKPQAGGAAVWNN